MRANGKDPAKLSDSTLWQRSVLTDAPDDDAARLLDLAGFADGTLDVDDRERVAEWLVRDAAAAADVASARSAALETLAPIPESVVGRAVALISGVPLTDNVVAFPAWRRRGLRLRGMAQWGSLAAAIAMAAWLGLTLGMTTSRAFVGSQQPAAGSLLGDLLDAQTPFLGSPGEGSQT
jgi:anti-sigma factor RsiW